MSYAKALQHYKTSLDARPPQCLGELNDMVNDIGVDAVARFGLNEHQAINLKRLLRTYGHKRYLSLWPRAAKK